MTFNHVQSYQGSEEVKDGKLIGKTGQSDYFYFLCPRCANDQVLQFLEYEESARVHGQDISLRRRPRTKKSPDECIILAFHLYCPVCKFEDFIKMDNVRTGKRLGK